MLPLLIFYVVAVCDLLIRLYTIVWVVKTSHENDFLVEYLPEVCKIVIGYTQFWTIMELTIRVK